MPQEQPDEPEVIKQARQDAFNQQVDMEQKWADVKARMPAGHAWRKQGPHLICMSCPTPHAHWVGMDFDTKHLTNDVVSHVPSISTVDGTGDITPKATTEPKRGRKKGA